MKRGKEFKKATVESLVQLIMGHRVVAIADLHKVTAHLLQIIRKKVQGEAILLTTKNTLAKRAMELSAKRRKNIEALFPHLEGSNLLIFTNLNPFKLSSLVRKTRMKAPVKAGDVAPIDIVVPAGNTGLPAGPLISEFSEVGLQTKIEVGSIVIKSDTVVAKKGEVISPKVASVLFKLGIKPVEVGISPKVAYDDGLIIPREILEIDAESVKPQVEEAAVRSLKLAMGISWPTLQTIRALLMEAGVRSFLLSLQTAFPSPETLKELIRRAQRESQFLSSLVEGAGDR